jgi:hypothetical protein
LVKIMQVQQVGVATEHSDPSPGPGVIRSRLVWRQIRLILIRWWVLVVHWSGRHWSSSFNVEKIDGFTGTRVGAPNGGPYP